MSSTVPPDVAGSRSRARAATRGTYVAFIASGFAFAGWASRIPAVRDRLHLQPSDLGLVLLAIALGSILALPLSGPVIARMGSRWTVTAMALLHAAGLAVVAVGYLVGVLPVVIGLFLFGFGIGAWDVAMNVQGALVERHLGHSIMPRFHAGYSVGTVAGALIGAAVVALGIPVTAHLAVVAGVVAIVVPVGVRSFLPDHEVVEAPAAVAPASAEGADLTAANVDPPGAGAPLRSGPLAAWTEPRTLLIGVFVLAFAFAEGTANDWISLAVIDGYHVPAAVGTLGFAVFLAAMTLGRWFGPGLLDRHGRVPVIRGLTLLALAGLVLFVAGPWLALAFVGAALWGVGVSLGFPVGMSAGADDPTRAAARVSVISSIGYCAFLAGPPLVGFLGQHLGVLHAQIAVAVLLGVAAAVAGNVRRLRTAAVSPMTDGQA
ncbi:MAG TPA: MFS transporter [Kineosporiaceae bacterium]|nr:MFS transporter [Kineosporiaceae bacterium]